MPSLSNLFVLEYNVSGAGVDAVNGDYRLESFTGEGEAFGDTVIIHRYVKAGTWKGNHCQFCLYSALLFHGSISWSISILQENDDDSTHFYFSNNHHPWNLGAEFVTDYSGTPPEPRITAKAMVVVPTGCTCPTSKGLLFSEKLTDFKFVCQDGETIPAVKFVLRHASPFFDAAFSGRWSDIDELETSHAPSVIKIMLTLLYTGNAYDAFDRIKEAEDPVAFLRVATEYQFDPLKDLTELMLIDSLTAPVLTDFWQAACHYDCNALKRACVKFARNMRHFSLLEAVEGLRVQDPHSYNKFAFAVDYGDQE